MSTSAAEIPQFPAGRAALRLVQTARSPSAVQDAKAHVAGPHGLDLVLEMAHDLRSPLTSIMLLAESLQDGANGPVNDCQRHQLGLLYSAALCLCASASDIIEMARQGDRLVDREVTAFSVSDVFTTVCDVVQPMAVEKGIQVFAEPPEQDRRIGYPRALNRLLLNLSTNALKCTERGYVRITARPTSATGLEFSVRDTGVGIDAATLEHLYEPFRPGPNQDRHHFSSAGLGLAICQRLLVAMGSELEVETQPNGGTRFFFELEVPPAERD